MSAGLLLFAQSTRQPLSRCCWHQRVLAAGRPTTRAPRDWRARGRECASVWSRGRDRVIEAGCGWRENGLVRRLSAIVVVLALTLTGCGASAVTTRTSELPPPATHARPGLRHGSSTSGSAVSTGTPGSPGSTGGSAGGGSGAGKIQHVVWIWFENEDQSNIIGNNCCTYFTQLAKAFGNATNYHALGHYSADNYTGATAESRVATTIVARNSLTGASSISFPTGSLGRSRSRCHRRATPATPGSTPSGTTLRPTT